MHNPFSGATAAAENISRPRGGTARRDPHGNLVPGEYNNATGQPMSANQGASAAHDWKGFDKSFMPGTSSAPVSFRQGAPESATGQSWMPPARDAGFASLPVGQGQVVADRPAATSTLFMPNPANAGKAMAMTIDPRYQTPGQSAVARSTVGGAPGKTYIGDETGDRTAQFVPGGAQSSQTAQATPISISNEARSALYKQYPNIFQPGHADNQAFVSAYQKAYDPSKPMAADDAMSLAHGLFAPPALPNSPTYNAGNAAAAQDVGANLVSHAIPSELPNAPLASNIATPGTRAAQAFNQGVDKVTGAVGGIGSAIGRGFKNAFDFESGVAPGATSAISNMAGGAYDVAANMFGHGPQQAANPAPPMGRTANQASASAAMPTTPPTSFMAPSQPMVGTGTGNASPLSSPKSFQFSTSPGNQPQTTPTTPTTPLTPIAPLNPQNQANRQAASTGF